ncbi:UNVERIFIED_CONTAM: hypothetical protein FKN15_068244 [Acipenser sinensis]
MELNVLLRIAAILQEESDNVASPPLRNPRHRQRYTPQVYRQRVTFFNLTEHQVLRRYRLDKATILCVCDELKEDLESSTLRVLFKYTCPWIGLPDSWYPPWFCSAIVGKQSTDTQRPLRATRKETLVNQKENKTGHLCGGSNYTCLPLCQ